jgi:hypothetical protein
MVRTGLFLPPTAREPAGTAPAPSAEIVPRRRREQLRAGGDEHESLHHLRVARGEHLGNAASQEMARHEHRPGLEALQVRALTPAPWMRRSVSEAREPSTVR